MAGRGVGSARSVDVHRTSHVGNVQAIRACQARRGGPDGRGKKGEPVMFRRDARIERLARCALFAGCKPRQLARIAAQTCPVWVEAGEVLVRQGCRGQEFYVVMTGHALVVQDGVPVATVGPGDFFGEIALLDRGPRTATVVATDDMELLVANSVEFDTILGEGPVSRHIAATLAQRLRGASALAA